MCGAYSVTQRGDYPRLATICLSSQPSAARKLHYAPRSGAQKTLRRRSGALRPRSFLAV